MNNANPDMTKGIGPQVLISTISATWGGVPSMLAPVVKWLESRGYQPVLAFYEPYGLTPELSVPFYKLGARVPKHYQYLSPDGHQLHAIGAWLPELEFTHYLATRPWRELIRGADFHISVSGNVLAATQYAQAQVSFLSWVATGWAEDRKDRVAQTFPLSRKMLDGALNAPVLRRLERRILKSGTILAISNHTRRILDGLAGEDSVFGIMPAPIDTALFRPAAECVVKGRVGFSGRIDDPRKNIELLLRSAAKLVSSGVDATIELIGGGLDTARRQLVDSLGLAGRVSALPHLSKDELRKRLSALDVFVVPSHQEGLCISALEAMACGCPVVSTRCGGPQDFVHSGITGELVGFDPEEMAATIGRVLLNPNYRARLATEARKLVESSYSLEAVERVFWRAFDHAFNKQT